MRLAAVKGDANDVGGTAKYFPSLVANLAPIVSPMVAMGRVIKRSFS
jgi:iron only hydrogenase large subunit-like protein